MRFDETIKVFGVDELVIEIVRLPRVGNAVSRRFNGHETVVPFEARRKSTGTGIPASAESFVPPVLTTYWLKLSISAFVSSRGRFEFFFEKSELIKKDIGTRARRRSACRA